MKILAKFVFLLATLLVASVSSAATFTYTATASPTVTQTITPTVTASQTLSDTSTPSPTVVNTSVANNNLCWEVQLDLTAGDDEAWSVVGDGTGNLYVAGVSSGQIRVLKLDDFGSILKNVTLGAGEARDIAINGTGNLIVTGSLGVNLTILTLDTNLNLIGQKNHLFGADASAGYGLALDGSDNIYVAGLDRSGLYSKYLASKFDANGNLIWFNTYTPPKCSTGGSAAYDIAVDASGNVFVTGANQGSCTAPEFGTIKYDSNGNTLWAKQYPLPVGFPDAQGYGLLERNGEVYVSGYVNNPSSFARLLKYDGSGSVNLNKSYSSVSPWFAAGQDIAEDLDGYLYLVGSGTGAVTVKVDADGNTIWVDNFSPVPGASARGVWADNNFNVYTVGFSNGVSQQFYIAKHAVSCPSGPSETPTATESFTETATLTPTVTSSPTSSSTPSVSPSSTSTVTFTPTPSTTPTVSPTITETETPCTDYISSVTRAAMTTARSFHGAAAVNGILYVVGGTFTSPMTTLESYDPGTNIWSTLTSMSTGRDAVGVAALAGKIYAVSKYPTNATGEVYDPGLDSWSAIASLPAAYSWPSLVGLSGKLYAFGGTTCGTIGCYVDNVYAYDPGLDSWAPLTAMPYTQLSSTVVAFEEKIYAFGGNGGGGAFASAVYDLGLDSWLTLTAMPLTGVGRMVPAIFNREIYLSGLQAGKVLIYTPDTDSWREAVGVVPVPSGAVGAQIGTSVFLVGGRDAGNTVDVDTNIEVRFCELATPTVTPIITETSTPSGTPSVSPSVTQTISPSPTLTFTPADPYVSGGLLGYWPLDTDTMNIVNGEMGVLGSGLEEPAVIGSGKIGGAYSFDNTVNVGPALNQPDHIVSPSSFEMGTADVTLSAWVKTSAGSTDNNLVILGRSTQVMGDVGNYMIYMHQGYLYGRFTMPGPIQHVAQSTAMINDNGWHYVVMVIDRDQGIQLYIDGVPDGSESSDTSGITPVFPGNFFIGTNGGQYMYSFEGAIDEPALWNRALSSGEVSLLNNSGLGYSYSVLVSPTTTSSATHSPTPTPSVSPSMTPTNSPSPTNSPTASPTNTQSATQTNTGTVTPSVTKTATPSVTQSFSYSPTNSPTPSATPTATVTATVPPFPNIDTVVGDGTGAFNSDGPALTSQLNTPRKIHRMMDGRILIADERNRRIRIYDPCADTLTTIVGDGTATHGGDGGDAVAATLAGPWDAVEAPNGDIYIADAVSHRVRKIDKVSNIITTVVGTGTGAYNGDGILATSASLRLPSGLAFDGNGDLYIADRDNHRIRKVVLSSGMISTVAGNGSPGYSGNGSAATAAQLHYPIGVEFDTNGDLYIPDLWNGSIRKVNMTSGNISNFVGVGSSGFSGDGGLAIAARLDYPIEIDFAPNGDAFIADSANQRIRIVLATTGNIYTYAGNGITGFGGDGGSGTLAFLSDPTGVVAVNAGVYISDYGNHRIRLMGIANTCITPTSIPTVDDDEGPEADVKKNEHYIYPSPPKKGSRAKVAIFMDQPGNVTVTIYREDGSKVSKVNASVGAGKRSVDFDTNGFSTGIYYYIVEIESGGGRKRLPSGKFMVVE